MGFYPRVQAITTFAFLRFPISNWTEGGETFGSFSQSLTVRPTHQLSIESTDSLEIAAPEAPFTTIASQRTALALWIP